MVEDSSLAFLTHHFSSERLHLISGRRNFARYSQNIKHLYLRQEARIITVRASFFAKTNRFLSMILSQKIMMKEGRLHECNNHADMFPAVYGRTAIQLDYTLPWENLLPDTCITGNRNTVSKVLKIYAPIGLFLRCLPMN